MLSVENPARKRSLHERIALALVHRGHLTPAWRHATAAGDRRLVGELIERFGVFQLWLREGVTRLISAGRFLTPELLASHPRLELLHCLVLHLSSRFDEANALFKIVGRKTDGSRATARAAMRMPWLSTGSSCRACWRAAPTDCRPPELDASLPAGAGAADGDERGRIVASARRTLPLPGLP